MSVINNTTLVTQLYLKICIASILIHRSTTVSHSDIAKDRHTMSGREWNGISRMGMTRNMQPAIRFPLQRKNNALHGNLQPSYNLLYLRRY